MRVLINPGHGGKAPGALYSAPGESPIREARLNLAIAHHVSRALFNRRALQEWDGREYMTRQVDRSLSLGARVRHADRIDAEAFVSIHCNAGHPSATGWEVFHWPKSTGGRRLASAIERKCLAGALIVPVTMGDAAGLYPKLRNRGIKEANYYVLRETACPAVLVECGFGTNARDLALLLSRDWRVRMGKAIADGIVAWETE